MPLRGLAELQVVRLKLAQLTQRLRQIRLSDATALPEFRAEAREAATRAIAAFERISPVTEKPPGVRAWPPEVPDQAWIASMETRNLLSDLDKPTDLGGAWVACDRLVRRLTRPVTLVLTSVGMGPGTLDAPDIQTAREVRALYSTFRRAVNSAVAEPGFALPRIRAAFARLLADPRYQLTRLNDRTVLEPLFDRVRACLITRDKHEVSRVISDAAAAAELMKNINQRAVLKEHDEQALFFLVEALDSWDSGAPPVECRPRLIELTGWDDQLDSLSARCLETSEPPAWTALRQRVLALQR